MSKPIVDYSLYYVTGRLLIPVGCDFYDNLDQVCQAGVTIVQLREKNVSTKEFLEIAIKSKAICDKYSIPLLINDRLDIALATNTGLHIGQSDLPPVLARKLLGPHQILGLSINTTSELQHAVELNESNPGLIDYLGLGPMYDTLSKKDHAPSLGTRGVRNFLSLLGNNPIKTVGIGGINHQTLPNILIQTPAYIPSSSTSSSEEEAPLRYRSLDGVAVISALAATTTPFQATQSLLSLLSNKPSFPSQIPLSLSPPELLQKVSEMLTELRSMSSPVVHHITNSVVMNDTANLTLGFGCSPIMSTSVEEASTLSLLSSSLLINLGTLNPNQIACHIKAGQSYLSQSLPTSTRPKLVIFDPVGCGATPYRLSEAHRILGEVKVAIIKGNAGEIGALLGTKEVASRGVDSVGSGFREPGKVVRELARREKLVVAMSGKIDYLSNGSSGSGSSVYSIHNGSEYQGLITGSGCMTSSSIACFSTLKNVDPFLAALAGTLAINIAAEIAQERSDVKGPNSFRMALIDECWNLKPEDILKRGKVERVLV